jgi:YHS domain-containing protein
MDVKEQEAAATYEYKEKKYYFCAPACKRALDEDPRSTQGPEGMKWPDMAVIKCSLGLLLAALGKEQQPCSFLN